MRFALFLGFKLHLHLHNGFKPAVVIEKYRKLNLQKIALNSFVRLVAS